MDDSNTDYRSADYRSAYYNQVLLSYPSLLQRNAGVCKIASSTGGMLRDALNELSHTLLIHFYHEI